VTTDRFKKILPEARESHRVNEMVFHLKADRARNLLPIVEEMARKSARLIPPCDKVGPQVCMGHNAPVQYSPASRIPCDKKNIPDGVRLLSDIPC